MEELKQILDSVDVDRNGAINYTEFIAATLDEDVYQDRNKIKDAFNLLDKDKDGLIDASELMEVLQGDDGELMDKEIFQKALDEVDLDGDGNINYKEFEKMMGVYGDTQSELSDPNYQDELVN